MYNVDDLWFLSTDELQDRLACAVGAGNWQHAQDCLDILFTMATDPERAERAREEITVARDGYVVVPDPTPWELGW